MPTSRTRPSFLFIVALLFVLSLSCDKNNPASSGIVVLQLSENPITIAVGYYRTIGISGGEGYYVITSISDSSVVMAQIGESFLALQAIKTGTTSITIEDSAKTAKAEVLVTVSIMAASPSQVKIKVRDYEGVYITGGTSPYEISAQPNPAIAVLEDYHSGNYEIRGVAPGNTFMTVVDNANPKNSITIPIYVSERPKFSTAGTISFQSNQGNFDANGIFTESDDPEAFPTNNSGAGGFLVIKHNSENVTTIVGYKKRSEIVLDAVLILISTSTLSGRTLKLDSLFFVTDTNAVCLISLNANITTQTSEPYFLTNGSLTLSQYSTSKAVGTFSGNGVRIQNGEIISGGSITVSNGMFNVPLLVETESFGKSSAEKQMVERWAKRIIREQYKNIFPNGSRKTQR